MGFAKKFAFFHNLNTKRNAFIQQKESFCVIFIDMKKKNKLSRFIAYYKPHKLLFVADMTCSLLVAATGMGYPIITRVLINDFIPNGKNNLILITSFILLGIYILRACFRYFINYYGHIMGVQMQAQMRRDMFTKLEKLPYSYFDNHETGKIMSRMTNDLFDVAELAHHGPENIFIASFTIIGAFTYLMIINWVLGLITFAMVPILFLVSLFFRKRMLKAFRATRAAQASINGSLESSITGIRVTKAYTNEDKELEKFEKSNIEFIEARRKSFSALAGYMTSSSFITDLFNIIIILAGGLFMFAGDINVADFTTFVISISLFINPVNQLIAFMEQYQSASSGFTRFLEVLDEDDEIDNGTKILTDVKGNIEFKNLNFKYESSDRLILSNVSFSIEPGQKVALIGPTGGGKTTICHLLSRFYQVDNNDIFIDGTDINDLTLKSLRSNIGIVQQDVFLFAGTLKENILYGCPNATDKQVNMAVEKANLKEFVDALPEGLETAVGERGVKLSGGQKQRVSIARAFLKNPSILILDEATSALDNTTEFLIQSALDELCKNRTTIVVAHRLSTIKNANKILVVSGGTILEEGDHAELMAKGGIYKNLYKLQFRTMDDSEEAYLQQNMPMLS